MANSDSGFKVGDKVRVKVGNRSARHWNYNVIMEQYEGKVYQLQGYDSYGGVDIDTNRFRVWRLVLCPESASSGPDVHQWTWLEEWLELLEPARSEPLYDPLDRFNILED